MKKALRLFGLLLGLFAVILVVGGVVVYSLSNSRIAETYELDHDELDLDVADTSVKRGRHLVQAVGKCGECHDRDLGGKVMADDPMFGRLVATNLTTGEGGMDHLETEALILAIRYGVNHHDDRSLILMPSQAFFFFTDQDLADIIAYLKTVPPVDRELPETKIGPLARFLLVRGALPTLLPAEMIDRSASRSAPEPGASLEYGEYLAIVSGCSDCHLEDLTGGPIPGAPPGTPPAADISTDGEFDTWRYSDFVKAMRQGIKPDDTKIDTFMPWKFTKDMTDEELRALWLYLQNK